MGPDHPQMEAYQKSGHHFTPATCASCHFPDTHNVNKNLDRLNSEYIGAECSKCHDQAFNSRWMDGAAMLEEQGKQILDAGRRIIEQLDNKKLLYPDPVDREANPVEGQILILGGHQLYEDTSRAEKLYFEMHKYLQIHLVQGAYHQDFKMAAYEGLIPLGNYLVELQAEALLLEELSSGKKSLTPIKAFVSERPEEDLYQKTYESSFHGVLPGARLKPDCSTCHKDSEYRTMSRDALATICSGCHTKIQADAFTDDLDEMKNHAATLGRDGRSIIQELVDNGIVRLNENNRVELKTVFKEDANRDVARTLVDRLNYYFGDLDEILKIMVVGAAHSNPDYAHWYGNAPAKSGVIEIRDAAHKLGQLNEIYGKRSLVVVWYIAAGAVFLAVIFQITGIMRRKSKKEVNTL